MVFDSKEFKKVFEILKLQRLSKEIILIFPSFSLVRSLPGRYSSIRPEKEAHENQIGKDFRHCSAGEPAFLHRTRRPRPDEHEDDFRLFNRMYCHHVPYLRVFLLLSYSELVFRHFFNKGSNAEIVFLDGLEESFEGMP